MTIVYNSLFHALKGKRNPSPASGSPSGEGDLFSRLHLIQDSEPEDSYGFHLDPRMPAVYKFSPDSEHQNGLARNQPSRFILLGAGLEGEEEETRKEMATCVAESASLTLRKTEGKTHNTQILVGFPDKDEIEDTVPIDVCWTAQSLSATFSMEILHAKPTVKVGRSLLRPVSPDPATEKEILSVPKKDNSKTLIPTASPPHSKKGAAARSPPLRLDITKAIVSETIPSPPTSHLTEFKWAQESKQGNFKLTSTYEDNTSSIQSKLVVEFIMENSSQKLKQGFKGDLLFRGYCGREWEAAVICSIMLMIDLRKEEHSEGWI